MSKTKAKRSREEFDPRIALVPERILVALDYALLSSLKEHNPDELRAGLRKLKGIIAGGDDPESRNNALDRLCSLKCDRDDLLWLVHPLSNEKIFEDAWSNKTGIGSTKALYGTTPKELQRFIKRLNDLARQTETVNKHSELGGLLLMNRGLYPLWRLPRTLRTYSRYLQYGARHFAGNSHIYHSISKARLTAYVRAKTGAVDEYYDSEIAALVSAIIDDDRCSYDAVSHRTWRKKHYLRLEMVDPQVQSCGPISGPFSASPLKS